MSCDLKLLFAQISVRLDEIPSRSLMDLSKEFKVTSRTIQNSVTTMTGRNFNDFRDDMLIAKLTRLFAARPASPIKELSSELGFESIRTFARAVRRACGHSPAQLRDRIVSEVAAQKTARAKTHTGIH